MHANSLAVVTGAERGDSAAEPPPSQLPTVLQRREGPFRDLDLLAIGSVLVVVLVILALRRVFRRR